MSATTCPVCGTANGENSLACVRCQTPMLPSALFTQPSPSAAQPGFAPNPYAVPNAVQHYRAGQLEAPVQGVWREGDQVVFHKGATLPDRCVKCNAPTGGLRIRQTLSWHHPAVFLAAFSPLIYLILALVLRKQATVELGVCARHVARRKNATLASAGVMVLGGALFGYALSLDDDTAPLLGVVGMLTLLVGLIVLSIGRRLVRPAKIDDRYAWLRGLPAEYVAPLPPTLGSSR